MTQAKARPRDPVGRRQALSAAVIEVIADVGVGRVTHRAVAARAGVPLGATTYYFPTLADLVASGLEELADRARVEVSQWADAIGDGRDLARTLSTLIRDYLSDRTRALLEYELYLTAARNPHLRPLAGIWPDGVRDLLTPITGLPTARTLTALIDGILLQALITGDEPDDEALQFAVAHLVRDVAPPARMYRSE